MLTPFHADGSLNLPLLCQHANSVLGNGVQGVTVFGTTGEGASIALGERADAFAALIDSGISASVITIGLCACAIDDVLAQVDQGLAFGVTRFLLLPPFYFTDLDNVGLFDWHSQLFEAADPRAQFILYHIPQVTQVPLSVELVTQLQCTYPNRVIAIKDSSGQWDNTKALIETKSIPVLVGDERLLHKAAAIGAAGSICGMANLFPQRAHALFDSQTEDADLSADVDLIVSVPVVAALKQAMVTMTGDVSWGNLRAPLRPLAGRASAKISARFSAGVTA